VSHQRRDSRVDPGFRDLDIRALAREARAGPGPGPDDADDPQLAAYNRYLAWLADNPDARPADYREARS